MPTIVVVGRGLATGTVEVRDRRTGRTREVPLADLTTELTSRRAAAPGATEPT
jgi:prolyl-tRNA synthetase